jgi:hypothetical protein
MGDEFVLSGFTKVFAEALNIFYLLILPIVLTGADKGY